MARRTRGVLEITVVTRWGFVRWCCCWLVTLVLACSGQSTTPSAAPQPATTAGASSTPASNAFLQIPRPAIGQIIYVPVYSHIYYQDQQRAIDLAVTLSIRNTDGDQPIQVDAVLYYDSDGNLVRSYLDEPLPLGTMASAAFVVAEDDRTGGVGANFIVAWSSAAQPTPPVVEAVMISAASAQGISFVSGGRVLESYPANKSE